MATFFPGPQDLLRSPVDSGLRTYKEPPHSFTHHSLLSGFSFSVTPNSPPLFISLYWSQAGPISQIGKSLSGYPFFSLPAAILFLPP